MAKGGPMTTRSRAVVLTTAALALALSGCAKTEQQASPPPPAAAGPAASAAPAPSAGPPGNLAQNGYPKIDLTPATVGFSQSEKEGNPFRIAETQSIKDEAAKLGITLQTTNAQSDLTKQISDI